MSNTPIGDHWTEEITKSNKLYTDKTAKYLASLRYTLRKAERGECQRNGCKEMARPRTLCPRHLADGVKRTMKWKRKQKTI